MKSSDSSIIALNKLNSLLFIKVNENIGKTLNIINYSIFNLLKVFKKKDKIIIYIEKIRWFYRFIISETILFHLYLSTKIFRKNINSIIRYRRKQNDISCENNVIYF